MTHWKPACAFGLILGLWLWVANDGRLHWDEAAFLYTAAYFDVEEIVAAEFQPSGISFFSANRILHILFCHALYSVLGVKPIVIGLITGVYLGLILGAVQIAFVVVRSLVPVDDWSPAAVPLTMFTPVCLWLSFKTMPEAPALFFASLSVLALLRSLDKQPIPWLVVGALCLAIVAFFKATLALSFLSFGLTLLLFNGFGYSLRRLAVNSLLIGGGSLGLFAAGLGLLGISLDQYLGTWGVVQNAGDPIVSRLTFTVLEAGLLYSALPLALIVRRRRQATFLLTWFLLSTLPLPFLLTHIEARYLLTNLIPLLGLVVMSLHGLKSHVRVWWRRPVGRIGVVTALLAVVLSGVVAQRIMAHEVDTAAMRRVIEDLDRRFGPGRYRIVVPWLYSDFHYLRVAGPNLDVSTVFTSNRAQFSTRWQKRHYGARAVISLAELRRLPEPVIYLGFDESMSVANLRRMVRAVPLRSFAEWADARIAKLSNERHFAASWMYDHPRIRLAVIGRRSHYLWARVMILPRPPPSTARPR